MSRNFLGVILADTAVPVSVTVSLTCHECYDIDDSLGEVPCRLHSHEVPALGSYSSHDPLQGYTPPMHSFHWQRNEHALVDVVKMVWIATSNTH